MSRYIDADRLLGLLEKADKESSKIEYALQRAGFQMGLRMAIGGLKNAPTINPEDLRPKWISVEERLPGTERVLITNGEFVKEGYRRPDGVWKYGRGEHMRWDKLSCNPITHWMPLPEPPIRTKDEKNILPLEDFRPKGKWIIKMDENDVEYAQCSACGKELYDSYEDTIDIPFNFCPNCGCRMVAVEREVLIEDL